MTTSSPCAESLFAMMFAQGSPSLMSRPLSLPIRLLSPPHSTTPSGLLFVARIVRFVNMLIGTSGNFCAVTVTTPFIGAVCEIFALPDGHFMFDPVYDIPVGFIGFFTVRGSCDHNDCAF